MIAEDWAQEAANEIAEDVRRADGNEEMYRAIIVKHCPFKPDVAYMPVPRCETCAHWAPPVSPVIYGECAKMSYQNFPQPCYCFQTLATFGCVRWKEKP